MTNKIMLKQATRIEGNAQINIEVQDGKIKLARFMVMDFRGFERFTQGRRVEHIPQMISRICGLCSASHQVASLKAIEDALGVVTPPSVQHIRDIIVLGEWIGSHALSYFFLSMPDFAGNKNGLFDLIKTEPEVAREAMSLRKAGQDIISELGKRAVHPVSMGIGEFLTPITSDNLNKTREIAIEAKEKTAKLIQQLKSSVQAAKLIEFPADQQLNFLAYDDRPGQDVFRIYDRSGQIKTQFKREEFEQNISEMRADWSLAKLPYLETMGFPDGTMLVGPLSRSYMEGGIMDNPDISGFSMADTLRDRESLTLESYDICRLLEIYWAADKILNLLNIVDIKEAGTQPQPDINKSGKGIGVIEAPRGVLMHSYLINRGRIEKMRLTVATQFNNAHINLLIKDIAGKHLVGDQLSPEGNHLVNRCVRIFDPCLSCATH